MTPQVPRASAYARIALSLATVLVVSMAVRLKAQTVPIPVAGPNVNMVSGKAFTVDKKTGIPEPDGDPFLQRQNEPSGAVSTRNPLHLLVGANDYRTVDFAGLDGKMTGDAWLGVFRSLDGGQTWSSTLIPGFPQDPSPVGLRSPLKKYAAGADPTIRAGTNGLFYYGGLAFNRGDNGLAAVFVSRFIDNNNNPGANPASVIPYLDTTVIDTGTAGQFVDKPWLAVDIPRGNAPTCTIQAPGAPVAQRIPAGNLYVSYVVFLGNDKNPLSKLMVARSTDCGATFSKPIKVSERAHLNQSAVIAIDPNTGALYMAWREFADKNSPDSILFVKSTDGGQTFTKPAVVATIKPFDQGGTRSTFRTNTYPTMVADGTGRLYLAWSERGWGPPSKLPAGSTLPAGEARVVLMTSNDGGATWTPRQPVEPLDSHPGHGQQLMPAVSFTAGKLTLVYYDLRADKSGEWAAYVDDAGLNPRHTIDVRAIQAGPGDLPIFAPSVQVSKYLFGSRPGSRLIEQLQFNVPNLPLYKLGTAAFIGDYIDVAGVSFLQGADGTWKYNTAPDGPNVVHAFWTDNRDVRPPPTGKTWKDYTPPAVWNPFTGLLEVCSPGQTGMRNSNIYTSRISQGLVVGAPSNTKQLPADPRTSRSFPVFAQNGTDETRRYRFTIANQPPGGKASFLQFARDDLPDPLTALEVEVAPRSTVARTVYVSSSDPKASVTVDVVEVPSSDPGGPPSLGVQASVVLNPDVTNPDVTNPDVTNPDVTNEVFNPDVTNPDVTNPDVTNPDVTNPDVTNPDVTNVVIANPDVTNPDVTNPDVTNPDVTNPDVTNPDVTNPDVTNGSIVDVSWTIKNNGNTGGSFAVKPFLTKVAPVGFKKQLILHKFYTTPITTTNACEVKTQTQSVLIANVVNPDVTNGVTTPDVTNPDVTNPDVTNATLLLEPGESARITLRVVNPSRAEHPVIERIVKQETTGEFATVSVPAEFDPSRSVAPVVVSQAVGTEDVAQGITTPTFAITLVISTASLDGGIATRPYFSALAATGGEPGPHTWAIVANSTTGVLLPLPPGLTIHESTGVIYGTPTTPGSYPFTVQVVDSVGHVNTQELSIQIAVPPPIVVTAEDAAVAVMLTAFGNDSNALILAALPPPHGSVLGAVPNVTYAPTPDYNGLDVLSFSATLFVTGAGSLTAIGAVPLLVTPVNDAPTADAKTLSASEDTVLNVTLSGADVETAAENFTFTVTAQPARGTLSATSIPGSTPTITYTPDANYNGPDSFSYTLTDRGDPDACGDPAAGVCTAALISSAATVSITVTSVNDAPSFVKGNNLIVAEDALPTSVTEWATAISAGPADEFGQAVNFIVSNDNNGLFAAQPAIAANGLLTFTPAANANGSATVTVQLHDNGGGADTSAAQTFTITVTPVNDMPVANSESVTTAEDTPTPIALTGSDTETSVGNLTFAIVTPPANGVLSGTAPNLTYAPATNYNGPDSFTFTVTDRGDPDNCAPGPACAAALTSGLATVSITVIAVNDAPVAVADSYTTTEDTVLVVDASGSTGLQGLLFNDSDVDAATTLTAVYLTDPTHGTLLPHANGSFSYTPSGNYNGPDSFTYRASDGLLSSNIVTVNITVTPVNDPPVADAQSVTAAEDTAKAITLSASDIETTAGNLTFTIVTPPSHGTLSGSGASRTYTPHGNYNGPDSFTFTVTDRGDPDDCGAPGPACTAALTSAAVIVSIAITPVNDPPVADAQNVTLPEDNFSAITLTGSDAETTAGNLTFAIVTPPAHGSLSGTGANRTYTPNPDFNGADSFTFTVTDRGDPDNCGAPGAACAAPQSSAAATVSITVTAVQEPPVAVSDSATTVVDSAITLNPAANDSDPDGNGAGGSLVSSLHFNPAGVSSALGSPSEIAVVEATGLAYVAAARQINVYDSNNALVTIIPLTLGIAPSYHRVHQAHGIVYFRAGNSILVVDGRELDLDTLPNPTFNTVIATLAVGGSLRNFVIDEAADRMYVTAASPSQSFVTIIDTNPNDAEFNSVLDTVFLPIGGSSGGLAVDGNTNKIYVSAGGAGVYVIDGETHAATQVAGTSAFGSTNSVVVNPSTGVVYAVAGTNFSVTANSNLNANLYGIDPHVGDPMNPPPTVFGPILLPRVVAGNSDKRLAVHNTSGRVYVRATEFPSSSRLFIVDGDPSNFHVVTELALGLETGNADVVVDQSAGRVLTSSVFSLKTSIVDVGGDFADTETAVIQSLQGGNDIALNAVTHKAYLVNGLASIQVVNAATRASEATIVTGAEAAQIVDNPSTSRFYLGRTRATTEVLSFDAATGGASAVSGLPAGGFGRFGFLAANASANLIYATNGLSDLDATTSALPGYLAVIDGMTNTVVPGGLVAVGNRPTGIGVNEATNTIYVANSALATLNGVPGAPGGITIVDGTNNYATTQADVSQIPLAAGFAPGNVSIGNEVVPNEATGKVYFRIAGGSTTTIGVLNGTIATPLPSELGPLVFGGIRVNKALNRIYVVSNAVFDAAGALVRPPRLHVLRGDTDEEIATFDLGTATFGAAAFRPLALDLAHKRVYVANFESDTLVAIDAETNAKLADVKVGDGPAVIAVNEALNRVYVFSSGDNLLTFVDGSTLTVTGRMPLPMSVSFMAVDPSTSRIFTSNLQAPDPGVMLISDPGGSLDGPLTVTSVSGAVNGVAVLNPDGTVTFTPAGTDSGSFQYAVSDGHGGTSTGTVNVSVVAPLDIQPATLPATTIGSTYSQTLVASGGTAPYSFLTPIGPLPGGTAFNLASGSLSGKLAASGTFTFTAQARDSSSPVKTAARTYTVIVGPPIITTTSLPNGFLGTPYNETLLVGGATGAVTWSLNTGSSPLPTGLTLNADGTITGTPTTYGSTPLFTVKIVDSLNQVATRSLSIFVDATLQITSTSFKEAPVLESFGQSPTVIGGHGSRLFSITSGSPPPGMTVSTTSGNLSGSPTATGNYPFTIQVVDCTPSSSCSSGTAQQTASRSFTLRVSARDQQGNSQNTSAISFGGPGGRKIAQIVTVGANGSLTAFGLTNATCPSFVPITVEIQGVTLGGLPDGQTTATGTASITSTTSTFDFSGIALSPTPSMTIDQRFAVVFSSPIACTIGGAPTTDSYNAGDAYTDAGGSWVSLVSTDGRYDIPFRTMIQPAVDVAYLNRGRGFATATLLANGPAVTNGKVLLTSNNNPPELYDPATNTSTLTAPVGCATPVTGCMNTPRSNHAATLLADGTVLVIGGRDTFGNRVATAETFDPATGEFTPTANNMSTVRENLVAVRLPDGRVLLAGGYDGFQHLKSADIYTPSTRMFSPAGDMTTGRSWFTGSLLANGKVLLAGGFTSGPSPKSAELYDPNFGSFTATAGSMVACCRGRAAATLLAGGNVLITGGQIGDVVSSAEVYDVLADSFAATIGPMASRRYAHTATLLADGSVLVAGGFDQTEASGYILPLATLERWVPATNTFVPAGGMEAGRRDHTAVRLANDKILLAGGSSQSWMTNNTAELYDVATTPVLTTTALPDGQVGVPYFGATLTASGGGGPPYQIAQVSGLLPPGITYDANTFTLSSTPPTADGLFPIGFRVSVAGHSNIQTLSIRVGTGVTITSPYRLTDGALNQAYDVALAATGTAPFVWSLAPASSPPQAGLSVTAAGHVTGTPTVTGNTNFIVRVVDGTGQSALKTLAINIQNPLTITTTTVPEGAIFESYTFCLGSSNGVGTRTWSVLSGTLPTGVSLQANGCFANPPAALGPFAFTAQVADQASPPQIVSQSLTLRVSAREQQGNSQSSGSISFGDVGGRKFAQVVTAGANGNLTAFGLPNISCSSSGPVTVEIQGLLTNGTPDGITVASGSATNGLNGIAVSPVVPMTIGQRFAVVISSATSCDIQNAPSTFDGYTGGDGYSNAGGGWLLLKDTDGRYDVPFRTLIQPAVPLTYLTKFRSWSSFSSSQSVVPLNNGKVFVLGTDGTAELVDPATNTSTATGSLNIQRNLPTVTLLLDGTVLVAGGSTFINNTWTYLTSAEIYNPTTGSFTLASGSMANGRQQHAAVRLVDGRVLITGGFGANASQSAEIYDPTAQTFSAAGNMTTIRASHSAVLLASGNVLLVGGTGGSGGGDVYNWLLGTFTATAGNTVVPRPIGFTATLLPSGKVLLAGGSNFIAATNTAELYDPATNSFIATGNLGTARSNHAAVVLADGSVLMAGGLDVASAPRPLATLERYVAVSGTFVPAGGMEVGRSFHTATRLSSDQILLTGGSVGQSWLTGNSAELYDAATTPSLTTSSLTDGQVNVLYPDTTLTATGGSGPEYQIAIVSGSLPPGLSYAPGTSTIAGTPTAAGVFTVGVSVVDSANHTSVQPLSVSVSALRITTTSLPPGVTGHAYSQQLGSSGGVGAVTWSAWTGSLPAGLTLSVTGEISGTPTAGFGSSFAVRAVDSVGQSATSASMFISIQSPLVITTTSLADGVALDYYNGGCLAANFGNGTRTWTIASGSLPPGLTLLSYGCWSGTPNAVGTFTFTVQVTDQASPPQVATQALSLNVPWAVEQSSSWDYSQPTLSFGGAAAGAGGIRLGERVAAGATGTLTGIRVQALSCPAGTSVLAQIQGVDAFGRPDGNTIAAGSATFSFTITTALAIPLSAGVYMTAGAPFALVLNAEGNTCEVRPASYDSYPGNGYVFTGSWQRLKDVDGRDDVPFQTLVAPAQGLTFTNGYGSGHVATVLSDGRVLLTGNGQTAEIYAPLTGALTPTGSMNEQRYDHRATLLDDGTVLITGGYGYPPAGGSAIYRATVELFHPNTETFELLSSTLSAGRYGHTATKLFDGQVLITGGFYYDTTGHTLQTADIYNPAGRTFSSPGTMIGARQFHTATLLPDHRVLIVGGYGSNNNVQAAEVYDPVANTFTQTAHPMVVTFRARHTATLLSNGHVLLAGGSGSSSNASAELYDPDTEIFTTAGALVAPRVDHTATLLGDGSVLLTGGLDDTFCCDQPIPPQSSMERYVPGSGFTVAGSMIVARYSHSASRLASGKVLVAGTYGWSTLGSRSVELYDPATAVSLNNASPPDGLSGTTYAGFTVAGKGGTGPYTIAKVFGNLPAGLVFDAATGTISGTPTQSGSFLVGFSVTDSAGHTNAQTLTIRIDPLAITTASLPTAHLGVAYSATLTGTGVAPLTWSLAPNSGSLPAGLTLNANGTITGIPTVSCCSYFFTVKATDSIGQIATRQLSIAVNQPLVITTTSLPAGNVTWGWGQCVNWTGGSGPNVWDIVEGPGALPPGITLNSSNGCLNGTFKATGQSTFTVRVTDSASPPQVATQVLSMRIGASDQNFAGFDQNQPTIGIGNGNVVAQTFRQGMTGHLIALWAPVACTATPGAFLTVDIRPLDGLGRPTGTTLATQTFDVNTLPAFVGGPYQRVLTFANPVFVPLNGRLAAVFRSDTGQCTMTEEMPLGSNGYDYPGGDAFQGVVNESGTTWTALRDSDASRPDLPIGTTVDPDRPVDFMLVGRSGHTSTLLSTGQVLLAGGTSWGSTAQLFTPTLHQFDPATSEMNARRQSHTATTLQDGRVLLVGGRDPNTQTTLNTAELYNPGTGTFTSIGTLLTGRFYHTATLLDDGRVLIAGGQTDGNAPLASTEIYDPILGFTAGPNMLASRAEHTATLLPSGDVLVVGGWGNSPNGINAERYVPGSPGSFVATYGQPSLQRSQHTAARLASDKILIAGGWANGSPTSTAEIYDPGAGADSFAATTGGLLVSSQHLTATRLDCPTATPLCTWSGKVLIAGGHDAFGDSLARLELYDPSSGTFSTANALTIPRSGQSATLLPDGQVLLAGGYGPSNAAWNSGERFDPAAVIVGIANPNLPDGFNGQTYGPVTLTGTGGTPPYSFTLIAGTLPPGLQFANGTISLTPGASGTYYFGVSVSDKDGYGTNQTLRIRIDAIDITTTTLPNAQLGSPYSATVVATGLAPLTFSLAPGSNPLPPGLTLNSDGTITGTPTQQGSTPSFIVRVVDGVGQTATANLWIYVD